MPDALPGRMPPSLFEAPALLLRFLPRYVRHLVGQPFRGTTRGEAVRQLVTDPVRCHRVALYDAVLDILLAGYAELSCAGPLRPDTGLVAVVLTRVGFAFDDEYERRVASGEPLDLDAVMSAGPVARRLAEWRAAVGSYDTYPAMRGALRAFVAGLYRAYRTNAQEARRGNTFATAMDATTLDSGGFLAALAHVVGRLHGTAPTDEAVRQFACVGVVAKLADDVVDFRTDVAARRVNLIEVLVARDPTEEERLRSLVLSGRRLRTGWLRRHCPHAYGSLTATYQRHDAELTSQSLRFACRLMWTPALLGHARADDSRGRI